MTREEALRDAITGLRYQLHRGWRVRVVRPKRVGLDRRGRCLVGLAGGERW